MLSSCSCCVRKQISGTQTSQYFVLCSSQGCDQKRFSVPVLCNTCPRKWIGISKDTNACFISFDWGMKSYSVNKVPGTGLMITKVPPSVSYSRLYFFFCLFICVGGRASGRSWKGEASREHGLSVCVGSGAGNSSHFCYWLGVRPWANHHSFVGLALAFHWTLKNLSFKTA